MFNITLNDVNEAPGFDQPSYTFSLPENSANGTAVGTVSATDVDAGDSLGYAILGDTGGVFAINPSSGAITVANTTALDFETTPTFNLQVQVTDTGLLTDTVSLTIDLSNVNEPPTQAFIGDRSVSAGNLLTFIVSATDPDVLT